VHPAHVTALGIGSTSLEDNVVIGVDSAALVAS
jgi:hypothetical protein